MIHLNAVFKQDLDIWNKSPGLLWRFQGYPTKGAIKDDPSAVQAIRKYWHYVKAGAEMYPPDCLVYA